MIQQFPEHQLAIDAAEAEIAAVLRKYGLKFMTVEVVLNGVTTGINVELAPVKATEV